MSSSSTTNSGPKISPETVHSKVNSHFKNDTLKEVLKLHFKNPKNKVSEEALILLNELMKTLVVESALRAAKQASTGNKTTVSLEHVEMILPQIMMDFP